MDYNIDDNIDVYDINNNANNNNDNSDYKFDHRTQATFEEQKEQFIYLAASALIKMMRKHNRDFLDTTTA